MLTKDSTVKLLNELELPRDQFWVIAGAAMLLHGLRSETADLDLGCSQELFDQLAARYGMSPAQSGDAMVTVALGVDLFIDDDPSRPSTTWIDGVQVVSLAALYEWKLKMNRAKDQGDLKLLRQKLTIGHPWWPTIMALAEEFDGAHIPYSFDASTALFVQEVPVLDMDDLDLTVQWGAIHDAHVLFARYSPSDIKDYPGWSAFSFQREGVPVHVLSYEGTIMDRDPDRVALKHGSHVIWSKSIAFYQRHAKPSDPRLRWIEDAGQKHK